MLIVSSFRRVLCYGLLPQVGMNENAASCMPVLKDQPFFFLIFNQPQLFQIQLERESLIRSSGREVWNTRQNQIVKNCKWHGKELDAVWQVLGKDFFLIKKKVIYFVPEFGIRNNFGCLVGLTHVFSMQGQLQHTGSGICTRLASWYWLLAGSSAGALAGAFSSSPYWPSSQHGSWVPRANTPNMSVLQLLVSSCLGQ